MIGQVVSHYRIVEKLGAGGMGEVFRAEDTRLHRTVALKFLPPELTRDEEARRRFLHEAEAAAALDHPNICTVYEVGESEAGQLFIAMACYEGETLRERLRRGPLPAPEAAWIASRAARGLAQAHAKGIMHRDIKPANLMLTAEGEVKVLDFGLAKLVGHTTLTRTGSTLGTVAYMSPEQAGGGPVDARTDIWSLGVVLFEMGRGRVPFGGSYVQEVLLAILNQQPEAPSKVNPAVPAALERVILLCLAKSPGERLQSMAELLEELGEVGVTQPVPLRPVQHRSSSRERRRWWVVPVLALLGLLLAAALVWRAPWRDTATPEPWRPVRRTLAVLPFENLGPPDKAQVADGVTEQVTSRLAEVYGLAVKARTDVAEYKSTHKKTRQIAEELGVDYLLDGSVRWQATAALEEQMRVTAQLIRASAGMHLWNEQYDEAAADILAKQSLIAEKVGAAMVVKLVDGEWKGFRARDGRPLYTRNAAAYAAWQKVEEVKTLDEALKQLEQAAVLDPGFTDAHIGLANDYMDAYFDHNDRRLTLAWQALEKLRTLEPDNPWYHFHLGLWYFRIKYDYPLAEEEALLAERGRPGEWAIYVNLSDAALAQEKCGRAIRYMERAAALKPREAYPLVRLGEMYSCCQRYADAERALRRAMALDPEEKDLRPYMRWALTIVRRDGDAAKAVRYLDSLPPGLRQKSLKNFNCRVIRAWAAGRGQPEQTLEEIEKLPDILSETSTEMTLKGMVKANWLRERGRLEEARAAYGEALRQLEKLEQERRGKGQEERLLATRSQIMAGLGRKEEALRLARQVIEMTPRERDWWNHFHHVSDLAFISLDFGETDLALDQLEYYFSQLVWVNNINELKVILKSQPILSHPRFLALAKKHPSDKPYMGE